MRGKLLLREANRDCLTLAFELQCPSHLRGLGLPVLPQVSSGEHAVTHAPVNSDGVSSARVPSDGSLPYV